MFPAESLPGCPPGIRIAIGRRGGKGTGTVPSMDLAYPPEADEFRAEIAGMAEAESARPLGRARLRP